VTRYLVEISASDVPESFIGAPLAIEIFSNEGRARRALLPLSGEPLRYDVSSAGTYLVRTTLPSGRVISGIATTPENADENGEAIGKTVLNLEETDTLGDFWRDARSFAEIVAQVQERMRAGEPVPAWFGAWVRSFFTRVKDNLGELAESALAHLVQLIPGGVGKEIVLAHADRTRTAAPAVEPTKPADTDSHPSSAFAYQCGAFETWLEQGSGRHLALRLTSLVQGQCGEDGSISPPDTISIGPLYLKIHDRTEQLNALMVWRPGPRRKPLHMSFNPGTVGYRSGSVLGAAPEPDDPMTMMLFQYIRSGAFEDARLGLDHLVQELENNPSSADPNRDILAGYVLYKLRHPYADTLIPRLCQTHSVFADCHLLSCAQFIAAGQSEKALAPLTTAISRGLPIYTEGIRLLRDSAFFIQDVLPDNDLGRQHARKARMLSAAANLDSTLTCLRLGPDLAVEFAARLQAA
jgi:hypothetical protein